MKWLLICLYISSCGNGPQVSGWGAYESKEACEEKAQAHSQWLRDQHKQMRQDDTYSFQCVEINP